MSEGFRNNLKIELNNCCCCWGSAPAGNQPESRYKSPVLARSRSLRNTIRQSFRMSTIQSEATSSADQLPKPRILTTYFIDNKQKLNISGGSALKKSAPDCSNSDMGDNPEHVTNFN